MADLLLPEFIRAHLLTMEDCNCWWLWHPCLLIWLEILHFSEDFIKHFTEASICISQPSLQKVYWRVWNVSSYLLNNSLFYKLLMMIRRAQIFIPVVPKWLFTTVSTSPLNRIFLLPLSLAFLNLLLSISHTRLLLVKFKSFQLHQIYEIMEYKWER